jgi:hypothetical protein
MTEQSAPGAGRENRSSWAWLIFDGPVALLILVFGVYFIVAQRDEWSARASEFQGECTKQSNLEHDSVDLLSVNLGLRAALPRLAEHPHDYPAPSIAASEAQVEYGCSPGETRPAPAMPSASINDLIAALIAPPRTD